MQPLDFNAHRREALRPRAAGFRALLSELLRRNRLLGGTALVHAVLGALFALLLAIDPRTLDGHSVWSKPLKFALSIGVYTATLAWLSGLAPARAHPQRLRRVSQVVAATMFGEIVLIGLQAARGAASHFNTATPLDGAIYSAMGVMILANTIAALFFFAPFFAPFPGNAAAKSPPQSDAATPVPGGGYLAGIRTGAALFFLGSVVGGLMSGLMRHSIGADSGVGLPFLGWNRDGGDLRIAHFLGLHGLQLLPLLGAWLDRDANSDAQRKSARLLTYLAALLFAAVFGAMLAQALLGQPLLSGLESESFSGALAPALNPSAFVERTFFGPSFGDAFIPPPGAPFF